MEDHNSTHNPSGSPAYDQQQTILLVDSDDANLQHMSKILRMSGYGVAVFHEATSALHFSIRNVRRFDLAITDHHLPGINGLEFVEALRSLHPDVPALILTDHSDIDTYFKAINPDVFEYINKPMSKCELLRVVQVALGKGMPERVPIVQESCRMEGNVVKASG